MTWLIACERNGRIRDAFLRRGIDAISCDIKPTTAPGPHIEGDVLPLLAYRWSGVIAHPECKFLTNAGVKHLYVDGRKENGRDERRWEAMREAVEFYRACMNANAPKVAVENPVMHGHAAALLGHPARHHVQPWWFGDPMFKATGWWLKGLPRLRETNRLTPPAPGTEEHKRWSWVHRCPPSADRSAIRSVTPPGMAEAIADQWGVGDMVSMMEAAE